MKKSVTTFSEKPDDFISKVSVSACWIRCDNSYLYVRRREESREPLLWCVPGGKHGSGESAIDAMHREVREETGITVPTSNVVDLGHLYVSGPFTDFTIHMYHCDIIEKPEIQLSQEHIAAKWLTLEQATSYELIACGYAVLDEYQRRFESHSASNKGLSLS